ncbi:MAG: hypothetical protein ACKVX9_12115, partial [Blastocatellia bacterium]
MRGAGRKLAADFEAYPELRDNGAIEAAYSKDRKIGMAAQAVQLVPGVRVRVKSAARRAPEVVSFEARSFSESVCQTLSDAAQAGQL